MTKKSLAFEVKKIAPPAAKLLTTPMYKYHSTEVFLIVCDRELPTALYLQLHIIDDRHAAISLLT